jgi:hypothetical protein
MVPEAPVPKEGMRAFLEKRMIPEKSGQDRDTISAGFPWASQKQQVPSGKRNKAGASGRSWRAAVAQLVERLLGKEQAEGSNPSRG